MKRAFELSIRPSADDAPAARVNGSLVWDGFRERLWLLGGNVSSDGLVYETREDVWSFDPKTSRWEEHQLNGALPPARLMHAALYDSLRDAVVMYGGADERAFELDVEYFGDLWALDLEALQWVQLHDGAGAGSDAPIGRFWSGLVHAGAVDRSILFGGHQASGLGNRNETWAFDPGDQSWSLLSEGDVFFQEAAGFCDFPPEFASVDLATPERRNAHTLIWSDPCEEVLLFGGKTDCDATDDVWAFDGGNWSERQGATEGEACLRWRDDPETCNDMCF